MPQMALSKFTFQHSPSESTEKSLKAHLPARQRFFFQRPNVQKDIEHFHAAALKAALAFTHLEKRMRLLFYGLEKRK